MQAFRQGKRARLGVVLARNIPMKPAWLPTLLLGYELAFLAPFFSVGASTCGY